MEHSRLPQALPPVVFFLPFLKNFRNTGRYYSCEEAIEYEASFDKLALRYLPELLQEQGKEALTGFLANWRNGIIHKLYKNYF